MGLCECGVELERKLGLQWRKPERERGNSKGKAKNEVNRRWAFIAG